MVAVVAFNTINRLLSIAFLLLIGVHGVVCHRRRKLYPLAKRMNHSYWLHALWVAFLFFMAAELVHFHDLDCVLHSVIVHAPLAILGGIYTMHAWNVYVDYKVAANQVQWCLQRRNRQSEFQRQSLSPAGGKRSSSSVKYYSNILKTKKEGKDLFSIENQWLNSFLFKQCCAITFITLLWAPPVLWNSYFASECTNDHASVPYVLSGIFLCSVLSLLAYKISSKYDNYNMAFELKAVVIIFLFFLCANTSVAIFLPAPHSEDATESHSDSHSHSHSHSEGSTATAELQEFLFHLSLELQILLLCFLSIGHPLYRTFHGNLWARSTNNSHQIHSLDKGESVHVHEFTEALKSPPTMIAFRDFLDKECSLENLVFYQRSSEIISLILHGSITNVMIRKNVSQLCFDLCSDFVGGNAKLEVNLPAMISESLLEANKVLQSLDQTCTDPGQVEKIYVALDKFLEALIPASKSLFLLMCTDSFGRFLKETRPSCSIRKSKSFAAGTSRIRLPLRTLSNAT